MNGVLDMIFRPLARLCVAKGLRFADVADRLRLAYFHEAQASAGENASDSKLAVMTGLQRRDIARLRSLEPAPGKTPDPLSRLVASWLTFNGGAPLRRHGEGSFDGLARDIRKDIHPRSMLDGLAAAGTVRFDAEQVHLLHRAHVPLAGSEAQLSYLGANIGDHLSVAVGNVLGEPEAFDLAVHYDGLGPDAADELERLWRARMGPVLEEVNERAAALQETQPGPHRIRGGGYFRIGENE